VIIGLILMSVAFLLARESEGLLIGEGVEPAVLARMREIVAAENAVDGVGDLRTMYFGPDDLLVNLDVAFRAGLPAEQIQEAVGRIEAALKEAYPEIGRIYIEVDSLTHVRAATQA
jgi:divalent metal cation (Fe/Co/Zn/Cd) transporter